MDSVIFGIMAFPNDKYLKSVCKVPASLKKTQQNQIYKKIQTKTPNEIIKFTESMKVWSTRNPKLGKLSCFWEILFHSDPETIIIYTLAVLKSVGLLPFYSRLCFHHKSNFALSKLCSV